MGKNGKTTMSERRRKSETSKNIKITQKNLEKNIKQQLMKKRRKERRGKMKIFHVEEPMKNRE